MPLQAPVPAQAPAPKPAKPKAPAPPAEFREGDIATMDAAGVTAILKDPAAPAFRKAKACVRAGELGAVEAAPALAALLPDPQMNVYARTGLEPMPGEAASELLRSALPKLKGSLRIGVVNSLGKRRDAASIPALTKLMLGPDPDLAAAAASALGQIGTLAAAQELRSALGKASGPIRTAIADAGLICAERLLADQKRAEAFALYTLLSAPDMPKPVRLAAMSGIIREETSVSRPR